MYLDSVDGISLIVAEPQFNMEFFGMLTFSVHLGFFEVSVIVDSYPFKFTPFDIKLAVDPSNINRYCTGMNYKVDTLKTDFKVKLRMNECQTGVLDVLTGGSGNCEWKDYEPRIPFYTYQI